MKHIIATTFRIYFRFLGVFFSILSPLVLPILAIRLIAHYAYLGSLTLIFSVAFGVVLAVVGIFVEMMLIKAAHEIITTGKTAHSYAERIKNAARQFVSYFTLKIIMGILVLIPAFLLQQANIAVTNKFGSVAISTITVAWVAALVLLFLFSTYIVIIEGEKPIPALKKSVSLFLVQPITTITHFVVPALLFGLFLTLAAIFTDVGIGLMTNQMYLVSNEYLTPWWQLLVIDIYALIGVPFLVIIVTQLFVDVSNTTKFKKETNNNETGTGDWTGNTRPA